MRSWLSVKNVSWSRLTFHCNCRPNHLKVGDLLEFIFIINPNKNYIFSIHEYFERIVSRLIDLVFGVFKWNKFEP